MRVVRFIEGYFWIFLLAGIVLGLSYPVFAGFFMSILKPLLMIMLFFVFLKTDLIHILKQVKDYRLMLYLVIMFMIIIPLLIFMPLNFINQDLAIGILLLTAMPAAVSGPSLTDIVKGNIALASGITIITSIIAPFTVPLLFRLVNYENLSINTSEIFIDLVILVFIPLILSQVIKKIVPGIINKGKNKFTAINILIIFIMVYAAMGSQRELILNDSISILWKVGALYILAILLHFLGYLIGKNHNRENKVAIIVSLAYKNNGMAIVLAAIHFHPSILILMILSEFPWATLLAPFRRIIKYL